MCDNEIAMVVGACVTGLWYAVKDTKSITNISSKMKGNSFLQAIWKVVKVFFIALFLILGANYTKDKIKEWWNK